MVLDHSERFPLTGLVSLSARSLTHSWSLTLPEVALSLLKKLKWLHHLSGLWTILHLCWKQVDNCHRPSVAWPHIPCMLKTSHSRGILIFAVGLLPISHAHSLRPLKRHTDTCCGIATYIAHPLTTPTQEAFWYLPWDCYLYRTPTHYAHSRDILILAVELLLALSLAHFTPHSRGNTVSCVDALSIFTLVVTVSYSGHKPTHVHSRDKTVNCREPLTLIYYL